MLEALGVVSGVLVQISRLNAQLGYLVLFAMTSGYRTVAQRMSSLETNKPP